MARPIAETPILTGKDAIRFEELVRKVDEMSHEQRAENRRIFEAAVKEARKVITWCD